MKPGLITFAGACLLFILTLPSVAENSTREGGYTVHHNAIPTALLTPEIAGSYQIVRSKYRGMLSVSVIKDVAGTTGKPVTARITARSKSLSGQIREIDLREIREEEAVYYIGEFPIVDREQLDFTLEILPQGEQESIRATLSQQFFID